MNSETSKLMFSIRLIFLSVITSCFIQNRTSDSVMRRSIRSFNIFPPSPPPRRWTFDCCPYQGGVKSLNQNSKVFPAE